MPQPRERDIDDTRARLIDWFPSVLPGARDLSIEGLGGPSDTGFSSDTLMFDLSYAQDGEARTESLVVRVEPAGGYPIFPGYDVAKQFHIMRAVRERGVPAPRMRWLEPDAEPLGAPFYVMDRMDGQVPSDQPPYHQGGWVFELAPERRTALWWSGLEAMAKVHRLDVADPAFDFLPRPAEGVLPIEHELDYWDDYLAWGGQRERLPLLERALAWMRANAPREEPVGICWGDSRLANQIFQDCRCVAVIDWEMVFVGNPVADLGWWTTLDRCFSEGIGLARAPGMPGVAETVARWEELVGRKAESFAYYELFAAFRFAAIMARMGGQMKFYELLPADHDFDSNNLATTVLAKVMDEIGVPAES